MDYVKKPVNVSATQLTWINIKHNNFPEWMFNEDLVKISYTDKIENSQQAIVKTPTGEVRAKANDWVVNENGILSVYGPNDFHKSFVVAKNE